MVLLACPGVLMIYAMLIDATIYYFRREDYFQCLSAPALHEW